MFISIILLINSTDVKCLSVDGNIFEVQILWPQLDVYSYFIILF